MIAISQPTFFPWIGYFDIIDQVDKFVILDDVDFSKQSWHQRNKFKTSNDLKWFTVPVKSLSNQKLNKVEIVNPERLSIKFKKFIETNYIKSNFYKSYSDDIFEIFSRSAVENSLANLNINIINFFLKILKIETEIKLASELNIKKKRSEKIIEICKLFNDQEYLSSSGAKIYLEEDKNVFIDKKISVFLHNYNHPIYRQLYPPFKSYACILDLVFNEGENSLKIIRNGRNKNFTLY